VQASAEGWKSYLANPAAGNALIKKDNPQMGDDLLAYGVRKMREYGIVSGGGAATAGLFSMTDARWQTTIEFIKGAGIARPGIDYTKAWSLEIVDNVKVTP
jgi:NitT/TauT family transport system substrate-binding protein